MFPKHLRWSSIQLLHNVVRTFDLLNERDGLPHPHVTYRAKIKIHGTNAGIQRTKEGIFAQSRSQMLSPGDDNKGFARWVEQSRGVLEAIEPGLTVFGEWCGPGVERGMAISKLDRKVFAVFSIQRGQDAEATLEVEPEVIRSILPAHPDLFVIPWHGLELALDFGDKASLEAASEVVNAAVAQVEAEDPWVKVTFGVSGLGEGLVLYPMGQEPGGLSAERFERLAFKAKGDKHRTAATARAAQPAPEKVEGVEAFVALMVTEARLQQGVSEACGGELHMKHTGRFLAWLRDDVQKESRDELEEAGLTWKQVRKSVDQRARSWFQGQVQGT